MANTLGKQLAALRKEKSYTQKQVAEMLNISNKTLSSWEVGNTMPDLEMLPKIADIYGVSCDELLRENVEPDYTITHACDNSTETDNKVDSADKIADAVNQYKKLNAIYIVYILLYTFIFPIAITTACFFAYLNSSSMAILFASFLTLTIALYITGIALNRKTFRISDDSSLIKKLNGIRYKFAMSNMCVFICSFIALSCKNIISIPQNIFLIFAIILIFIFADKIVKIKIKNNPQKQTHIKSMKVFVIINAIMTGVFFLGGIILAVSLKAIVYNDTHNLVYAEYHSYLSAINVIQDTSELQSTYILEMTQDKPNDYVSVYFAPRSGSLSKDRVAKDFEFYDYRTENGKVIVNFKYKILDTPDGQIRYYVANPDLVTYNKAEGKIVNDENGNYVITYTDTDPLLLMMAATVLGVDILFLIASFTITVTIIAMAVYDNKLYNKDNLQALQKTS